ncbi:hypothetical protein DIE07_32985 [Burkholderia sp. Bp9002]|nr:hypothetical protein DIE07_32985 [Burkholderia sp. Bp9002]
MAVLGGGLGLASAVGLTVLSKSVWVDVLHHAHAPEFPDNPALVSVPLAGGAGRAPPNRPTNGSIRPDCRTDEFRISGNPDLLACRIVGNTIKTMA